MKNLLRAVQGYFMPSDVQFEELERRKVLVLINVTLVTTLFTLFYLGATILFVMPNVFWLMVICAILFLSNAFMIKWGVARILVANLYVAVVLFASFGVIYFTEGLYSFDMPWLALGPVCAILLDTGRRGWIWLIVAVAVVVYFGVNEMYGVSFPMEIPTEYKGIMFLIAFSGLITILYVITNVMNQTAENSLTNLAIEKKKSDDLVQIKDRFFAIVSHDLRGPISAFKGISDVMKMYIDKKRYEDLEEMSEDINDSVHQISGLLDNLLQWANMQQGQITHSPEKLKLNKMIDDLFETMKFAAASKKIELEKELPDDLYLWVDSNSTMTVLRNLLSNALKFTNENGRITISAKEFNELVVVEVKDTGVGIPQEKIDSLFQLKAVKSSFGTAGEKGVGLGLQLVKDFTELNRGDISVKSEVGLGTTFTLKLPRAVP